MDLRRHLPNLLSGLRIALVPVLLWLAWTSHPTAFLMTFAFSLSTDLLDGYLARRMRTGSELGAKLDSWGDLATYAVFPLCAWWLFRERMVEQLVFVIAALIGFVSPTLIGLLKFRRITSYHTRLAKLVAVVMGVGLILYLGFNLPRLFQGAVLFLLVEAIEEIAITAVLPEWRANVPSLFAALRVARGAKAALVAFALLALPAGVTAQTLLPDLVPEVSDVHVELFTTVAAGDVVEGCAPATTGLDLIRLDLTTVNTGRGELFLGDPMCPNCFLNPGAICTHPDFVCSPAGGHNHPHYSNFLRYELLDEFGSIAAVGGKRSFCLAETDCSTPRSPPYHDCDHQGLYPGCWDTYYSWLGCQYVDVTHLPDGAYTLRVTVDPQAKFAEEDETNNVIEEEVLLFRAAPEATPLPTGNVLIKAEKSFSLVARATEKFDLGLGGRLLDPTHGGAQLTVSDRLAADEVGDQITFDLPASGWKLRGKASDPRAFRYKGSSKKDGDCTLVQLTRRELRASCNLRGEHKHFELPVQGNVFSELRIGSLERRFCASFGGKNQRNDEKVVQRRRRAPKPLDCDTGDVIK